MMLVGVGTIVPGLIACNYCLLHMFIRALSTLAIASVMAVPVHANDYTVCNQHGVRHHFNGSMISIGRSGDVIINHNGAIVNGKWAYSHTPGYVTVFANGRSHDFSVACPWGTSRF